jgi:hypothetical protein
MPLSEGIRPLLAARAATDPNAARLLEMFTRADQVLSEHSLPHSWDSQARQTMDMYKNVVSRHRAGRTH